MTDPLTELLERAAARNLVDYVSAYRQTSPELEATAMPFAGGTAAFTGIGSPLTTIKGAGPEITDEQFDQVEAFYHKLGAGQVVLEAAAWVSAPTLVRLRKRGYVPSTTENLVVREDTGSPGASASSSGDGGESAAQLDLLGIHAQDVPAADWPALMLGGFELEETPVWRALAIASAHLPRARLLGVRDEMGAWMASAQLAECGPVAIFGCDSTLPHARGRGAQLALIRARLASTRRGLLAAAEVSPGGGSERNYIRCGFRVVYGRRHYIRELG